MPLQKLQFRSGVNREVTTYSNEGGWFDGNKIRFRFGFPEKIGGWVQQSPYQFLGIARSLWNWIDLNGNSYIGVGTNLKYYIQGGGYYNDITPISQTTTTATATTVNGSRTVTMTDTSYNPNVGDYFYFYKIILRSTYLYINKTSMKASRLKNTFSYKKYDKMERKII